MITCFGGLMLNFVATLIEPGAAARPARSDTPFAKTLVCKPALQGCYLGVLHVILRVEEHRRSGLGREVGVQTGLSPWPHPSLPPSWRSNGNTRPFD